MRTRGKWGGTLSPRLPTKILIGLLTGTLLASAGLLAFPSQSFSLGDLNLAAADTIRGSGGGRLASYPALSGDGSTVIFGQPGHWGWAGTPRATVEVREWNGSSWVAKGALPDAANREIGYWHDISDNGDVVSYSTHVLDKVFVADWSGSAWVQRPTITASQAGVSLVRHSLSGDGNVLVVGERLFDNGGEVNNGKVRTLDWDGSSWSERTAIIGAEGELLGNSRMDITADGATISFGGSVYSNADGAEVGRVRVATWDGASWTERPALTGSQASARAANPVLSDDGTVLGFSEGEHSVSGRIRTFDWRDSAWVERPRAADGAIAWIDLDISASGTAISLSDNNTQKVRVYDWVGDAWVQRGSDVPTFAPGGGGHYGNVASLSSSGLSVATSQIYSDVNGSRSGRVDIYRSPGALRGVVFDSNGGSGAMSTQTNYNSAALSSSSFSKTAATFSSWNTAADGSGTDYADGATYDFLANVTFYAQWAPIAVTFDANSGSGSMADQSAAGSTALTSNSFTRQAYSFAGWNTAADGSGTAYANGASYAFAASATLYAQWDPVVCVPDTTTVGGETVLTFTSMSGCHWTAPAGVTGYDYVVVGGGGSGGKGQQWNTAGAGGSGGQVVQGRLSVVPGQSYEVIAGNRGVGFSQPGTASVFDAVTASGGNAGPSPRVRSGVVAGGSGAGGAQSGGVGGAALGVTIRGATEWFAAGGGGHLSYHYSPAAGGVGADGTRAGGNGQNRYNTGQVNAVTYGSGGGGGSHGGNGGRSSYPSGNGYQGVVILREVLTDTVTFDANSGSGTMADQTDSVSVALSANTFTRPGYTFKGWNSSMNGSGTPYADGATYDFSADVWLFAQWSAIPQPRSAESESANAPLIVQNDAPVPALRRATPLAEPDQPVKKAPVVIERDSESPASEVAAEAVALVGGEAVIVQSKNIGSQSVVFDTGAVTVGVTVAPKDGVVNSAGGKTSLKIAKNAAAQLQGAGLKPDSMVQVFLPASSGSFIELPSVRVSDSGSFEASLTMGSSVRAKPMPIGKNSIQMIGVDQNGKDTVLDIPITIAQSLPAPETNRVNGQRPVLKPGETLALNAGTPDTVTLTRSDAATSLEGNDWGFTVEGAISDESMETLAFTRDAPVAFSGTGFMPGTRADVWLFSDPILVGTVDIAADGTFSTIFAVDSNFVPTGNHTLQMQGVGTDGYVRTANLGVVVQDEMNTPVVPVEVDPLNVVPLLLIGTSLGGLLVLVGVTIAIGRRQRARGRVVPAL